VFEKVHSSHNLAQNISCRYTVKYTDYGFRLTFATLKVTEPSALCIILVPLLGRSKVEANDIIDFCTYRGPVTLLLSTRLDGVITCLKGGSIIIHCKWQVSKVADSNSELTKNCMSLVLLFKLCNWINFCSIRQLNKNFVPIKGFQNNVRRSDLNHGYDSDLFWKIQGISNYLLTPIKLRKHLKKFQYWTLYIGIVVNRISFQVLFFMQNCPSLVKTILGQPEKA
jgi:hypothetical protein